MGEVIGNEALMQEYDTLATNLLDWIQDTICKLSDRTFDNVLSGAQQQLVQFNTYRTTEKPPKSVLTLTLSLISRYIFTHLNLRQNPYS